MPNLPLVVAGPIVRRVEGQKCSFWIALRDSATVTAKVWQGEQFAGAGAPLATATASTRAFGVHLHIAVVTVELPAGVNAGVLYSYDLSFNSGSLQSEGFLVTTAASGDNPGRLALGYVNNRLPSFMTPGPTLQDLKIAHASCRKTNGPGFDALAWLDDVIADNFNKPDRPQQLFLTGDQIYADEVASPLLPVINELALELIGGAEAMLVREAEGSSTPELKFDCTIKNFPAMLRQLLLRTMAGFSSTFAHNHLIAFGEYAAMYSLAWNPGIWRKMATVDELFIDRSQVPADLRPLLTDWEKCHGDVATWKSKARKEVEEEIARAETYRRAVPKVARALANTITYMIMDDHEVTDDWNLTQRWRLRVYSKPLGRAIVRNGVMAYGAFQGWGNEPSAFSAAGNNKDFLEKTSEMVQARGNAAISTVQRLDELIGASGAGQSKQAKWHYTVPGPRHLAVVMDSRTRRKFSGQSDFPPDLLGDSLKAQIPKGPLTDGRELLVLISPAPVLGTTLFDKLGQPLVQAVRDSITSTTILRKKAGDPCTPGGPAWGFEDYDAEGWAMNEEAQQNLLVRLAAYGKAVILSGDVHYGLSMEMDLWRKGVPAPSRIVQLTSSPARNEFKPIIQALIRSNALLQDFERGLQAELLAWKDAPAPINLPTAARIGLGRRARMLRSPALLPTRGWPAGTSFPSDKRPDWSWRLTLVRDQRPNSALPAKLQQPALIPAVDVNPADPLPGYAAVASRQALLAATHFDHLRQMVFNTNFGLVSFSGSGDALKLTHTLMSHNGEPGENKATPNTVVEIALVTPSSAQPPVLLGMPPLPEMPTLPSTEADTPTPDETPIPSLPMPPSETPTPPPTGTKTKNAFKAVVRWFKDAAEWVQEHLGDPAIARALREDLGLKEGEDIPPADKAKFKQFAAGLDPDKAAFAETIAEIAAVTPEFLALAEQIKSDDLDAADVSFLVARLAAVDSLKLRLPILYSIFKILTLVSDDPDSAEMLDVDMLVKLIRDGPDGFPPDIGRRIAQQLVPSAIVGLLEHLLLDKIGDPDFMDFYYGWDPAPGSPTPVADTVASRAGTILLRLPPSGPAALALTIIHVPPEHGGGGHGLFLALNGGIDFDHTSAEDNVAIRVISFVPGQLNLFVPLEKAAGEAKFSATSGSSYAKLSVIQGSEQTPALRIGEEGKTRIDIAKLLFEVEFSTEHASVRLGFKGAKLIVDLAKDGDEFVSNVGGQQVKAGMDFGLIADTNGGLRVDGGAGFKATFPGGEMLGGALTVHHIDLALGPGSNDRDVGLEISGAFAFKLGPFKGAIDRLGFALDADFREGNLGWLDLALGFRAPMGLGLSIDAAVVKGGGYLFIDKERGEYAGALELTIGAIGIKAIVILSTKMPDGSPGWSLLLLIYSQFPPIQLSWGFTLNGVGGMIGVQHGLHIEELKTGMRTGALDDVLFPKNPVADAPRIINRLRAIFPATPRALVVGPMVELGWGTPSIIKIRMGLLFQLDNVFGGDSPVSIHRIILLGQLLIQLPPEVEDKLVTLKLLVDFYGYYDFDLNRLEFAARLRDSHVIKLPVSGMLLVRAEFGEKPVFILSAGGFHPNFRDLPAGLPAPIDRLQIKFKIGRLEVRAQKYFAITPASIQTGADVQVEAKIGPVKISGSLGYDAILYLEPRFFFEVDIRAGVTMKYKGHKLASVTLKLHLEGPGRWRARGEASFSILLWDVDVDFDESWGDEPEIAPAKTNVAGLLQQALSDKGNWRAQLPQGGHSVVTLAMADGATGVLAHPLGQLQISQKVAPLGLELQRFGNTQVDGAAKFEVTQVSVAGQAIARPEAATDYFARAQFVDMSDEQKLSAPSFEKLASGVTVGSDDYLAAPEVVAADLRYETAYLMQDDPMRRPVNAGPVSLGLGRDQLYRQAQHGAAARSALRSTATLRPTGPREVKLQEPPLAVTNADTHLGALDLKDLARTATSLAEQTARGVLGDKAVGSTHVIVEAFELVK